MKVHELIDRLESMPDKKAEVKCEIIKAIFHSVDEVKVKTAESNKT
jgi:hypothetical protein